MRVDIELSFVIAHLALLLQQLDDLLRISLGKGHIPAAAHDVVRIKQDEACLQPALAKELAGRCAGKKEPPRPAAVVRFVASGEDRRLRQAEARWLEP